MSRRIVVTGIGVISPIGIGKEEFFSRLLEGVSGCAPVEGFDTSQLKYHYGCEVSSFCPEEFLQGQWVSQYGRASAFSMAASQMALADANIDIPCFGRERIGIAIGTGLGEIQEIERLLKHQLMAEGIKLPDQAAKWKSKNITQSVAELFSINGTNMLLSTACSAGSDAIAYACMQLIAGKQKAMLAGGVEVFSQIAFWGFSRLKAIEEKECRPFDADRKGIMIGEGAGIIVLETLESAIERKVPIYGEIIGWGTSSDAYHITAPDPAHNGGMERAMKHALKNSGISLTDIDYICAHGTGTVANDKIETAAIKRVFGEYAYQIPVSSIKSMIGHTGGAAGAIGTIAGLLTLCYKIIPPTINYRNRDPQCDLDYVGNVMRKTEAEIVMNNSFAFGGNNTSLIIGKYDGGLGE